MKNGSLPAASIAKAPNLVMVSAVSQPVTKSKPASDSADNAVDKKRGQKPQTSSNASRLGAAMKTTGKRDSQSANGKPGAKSQTSQSQAGTRNSRRDSVDEGWDAPGAEAAPATSTSVRDSDSGSDRPINPSKFPSALRELAKSDPSLLAIPSSAESPQPSVSKSDSIVPAPVVSVGEVSGDTSPAGSVSKASADLDDPVRPRFETLSGISRDAVFPAPTVSTSAISATEVAAPAREAAPQEPVSPEPSRPSRARHDSLLSLDAAYAVEFFSSAPPAYSVESAGSAYAPDFDDIVTNDPRSLPPTAAQLRRQNYLRKVVLRVMVVALALFAFALYVLWRRGGLAL
ncbi:MAG: hypothetical protein QM784_07700 [Polyangiaceae bacterium]